MAWKLVVSPRGNRVLYGIERDDEIVGSIILDEDGSDTKDFAGELFDMLTRINAKRNKSTDIRTA